MTKKIVSLFLALVLLLGLMSLAQAEGYRVGFANASVSNSWRAKMRDMLMEAADELGVEIIETDAHDDASTMISNIETLLLQNLDAILITPCTEDGVNAGIELAYEEGPPVIIFDRECSTEEFTHFIGYSDEKNGAACAQMVVDALVEKYGEPRGTVVALDSMAGTGTDNNQKAGQDSVFSQYPDIQIVARNYTDFEVSVGKAVMEDWLTKFGPGEIDAIISQDGGATLGAYDAIIEAGREGDNFIIVNADGINGVARLVAQGKCYGYTQFPCAASVDALKLAIACIEGTDPEDKIILQDAIIVDSSNNSDYYLPDGDDYDWTY